MVIASSNFPPESLLDLSFSALIPPNIDSTDFFIPVPPDTFKAVVAVLKIENQSWVLDNIIGLLTNGYREMHPKWQIETKGHVWWKIRTHANHFEQIRSCYIKARR